MATAAAASSGLAWEDTSAYLNALDTLLTTTPDTDALAAWRSAKQELQATFGAAGAHAKRVLQELQASYARAEAASAEAALPIEELRLRLEQVEGRKAAVLERVQHMAVARDASAAAMQRLLQDTLALREEQRRLEGMKQGASPQLQCVRWGGGGAGRGGNPDAPAPRAAAQALSRALERPLNPPSPPPFPLTGISWRCTLTSRASSGTTLPSRRWRALSPPPMASRPGCCALTPGGCPACRLPTGCGQRWARPTGCPRGGSVAAARAATCGKT